MPFCPACGSRLVDGAKFCHQCGTAAIIDETMTQPNESGTIQMRESSKERKQEFVGTILKCPNCGGVISETTAVCPDCGIRLAKREAVSSVQEFKEQLMEIESTRKSSGGLFGAILPADSADVRKLTLIRNYPIPNSVDDVMEFMFLAIANIDVKLSKRTAYNKFKGLGGIEQSAEKIAVEISDAWVAKMEQAYRKAELVFPNDPAFPGIQRIYFEKMQELKIKV